MEIQVKALNGKIFNLNVQPNDSIKTIKRKIEEKEGIPMDEQTLIFEGSHLDDSRHLDDYHIQKNFTVDLIVAFKGG